MGFLTDLTDRIRRDLLAQPLDASALLARTMAMPPPRDLEGCLRARTPSVIAEVKRASPSAGAIADRDPITQAAAYEVGGAAAISVLTEPRHFHGSLLDLQAVRTAVRLPLLRKDFLVDPVQVIESRAHGADAVLVIVACLTDAELDAMLATVGDMGMQPLVEAHSDEDLDRALATGAVVIGVNARDLETLDVDVDAALARLGRVPGDRLAVMESGIGSRAQVVQAVEAGASGILVGEALMRASDPAAMLRDLTGEDSG